MISAIPRTRKETEMAFRKRSGDQAAGADGPWEPVLAAGSAADVPVAPVPWWLRAWVKAAAVALFLL